MISKFKINTLAIAVAISVSFLSFSASADQAESNASVTPTPITIAYQIVGDPASAWGDVYCYPQSIVNYDQRTDVKTGGAVPINLKLSDGTTATSVICQVANNTARDPYAVYNYEGNQWVFSTNSEAPEFSGSACSSGACSLKYNGSLQPKNAGSATTASISSNKIAFAHIGGATNSNKLHKSHA